MISSDDGTTMNRKFRGRLVCLTALTLVLNLPLVCAGAPTVSNVRATQRVQTQLVDIFYDLSATNSGPFSVSVAVSTNNGATYTLPASSFTGNGVGNTVTPGSRKQIIWNAGSDWPGQYSGAVRFKVAASENMASTGMVLIPAGSFVMGATTNVGHEGYSDELPQHTVNVSAFYMDRYEVTKALWDEVKIWAGANGYSFDNPGDGKATNHPVHSVNWYDILKWCNARSQKEGLTPCYYTSSAQCTLYTNGSLTISNSWVNWSANGYRLPTEAEWEKAARGGAADTRFPWTDYTNKISHAKANYYGDSGSMGYDLSDGYHPAYTNDGEPYSSPVGSFSPNGYGLHDMAGNVWEWVWDWYSLNYYSTSPGTNPTGPDSGTKKTLRGGSWYLIADYTRCAYRNDVGPYLAVNELGFRCVRGL